MPPRLGIKAGVTKKKKKKRLAHRANHSARGHGAPNLTAPPAASRPPAVVVAAIRCEQMIHAIPQPPTHARYVVALFARGAGQTPTTRP